MNRVFFCCIKFNNIARRFLTIYFFFGLNSNLKWKLEPINLYMYTHIFSVSFVCIWLPFISTFFFLFFSVVSFLKRGYIVAIVGGERRCLSLPAQWPPISGWLKDKVVVGVILLGIWVLSSSQKRNMRTHLLHHRSPFSTIF